MLSYNDDYQHEENIDDQQVPIVEEDLSDHAKRHLIGMDEHLEEIRGEMFPEEMEAYNVQEIHQDGNGIGYNVNDVNERLQLFFVDDARGETVEEDVQKVDAKHDGQIEPHAVEIKQQGLPCVQLMEKLDVEQIEHPTADAERH